MLIASLPVIVMLVGMVVYALASNPKAAELGRILFAVGALVSLVLAVRHVVHFP
jgi:hypothetical protein